MNFGKRIASVVLCACIVIGVIYSALSYKGMGEINSFVRNDSVVIWYTDESMADYISAMAVAFHEEYGIRVIPQLHSGLDYLENIYEASVNEEKGPDVFVISNESLEKAYLAGIAGEITNPEGILNKEAFPQTALNAVTYHGKLIGYPYYFETSVLLYNKTYIQEMAKNQLLSETAGDPENAEEAAEANVVGSESEISQEAKDLIEVTKNSFFEGIKCAKEGFRLYDGHIEICSDGSNHYISI